MSHFVYALHWGDNVPFYVGMTSGLARRERDHRIRARAYVGEKVPQLAVLAEYAEREAAIAGEVLAWESLTRLGHQLNNDRPNIASSAPTLEERQARGRKGGLAGSDTKAACSCGRVMKPSSMVMHRRFTGHN